MEVTTSSRKSYNREALLGADRDDMDFINDWNKDLAPMGYGTIDPGLAYKPEINDAILNNVEKYDIEYFTGDEANLSYEEATMRAKKNKDAAASTIKSLLAKS